MKSPKNVVIILKRLINQISKEKDKHNLQQKIFELSKYHRSYSNLDFKPIISMINNYENSDIICQFLLFLLKYKPDEELNIIQEVLKINDPYLKAYTINKLSRDGGLNFSGFKDIIPLFESADDLYTDKDVLDTSLLMIKECRPNQSEFLENLYKILSKVEVKDYNGIMFYDFVSIKNTLKELLQTCEFSETRIFEDLFVRFKNVEKVLISTVSHHFDHINHSFRVFLLGLQLIIVKSLVFTNRIEKNDILLWIFLSFFHDIGYGIQKLQEIYHDLNEQYKIIGTTIKPTFIFPESSRILIQENLVKYFPKMLLNNELSEIERSKIIYYFSKDLDKSKHGIISSLIFLQIFTQIQATTPLLDQQLWESVVLRGALAMAFHTLEFPIETEINIDRSSDESSFTCFLLSLIDNIEFINRPEYGDIYDPDIGPFKLSIEMKLGYSLRFLPKRYIEIEFNIQYQKDLAEETSLRKIGLKIRNTFRFFYSRHWGIIINLMSKQGRKYPILLLKSEENEFLNFRERNNLKNNLWEDYKQFYAFLYYYQDIMETAPTENAKKKYGRGEISNKNVLKTLKSLGEIPSSFSAQIKHYLLENETK